VTSSYASYGSHAIGDIMAKYSAIRGWNVSHGCNRFM